MRDFKFVSIISTKEASAAGTAIPIKDLLADTSFDADVTRLLGQAFDQACAELHDNGQPFVVKEVIAKRIIELASEGERDPVKLSKVALTSLGLPINRYTPRLAATFVISNHTHDVSCDN